MAEIKDILQEHLNHLREVIIAKIDEYKRTASGRTAASLTIVVNGDRGTLYGSGSFLAIERGRRPGKVPHDFFGIIRQWIIDKGLTYKPMPYKRKTAGKYTPEERGLNSFAGAVAYKIMKEGTRMYRDNIYNDIFTTAVNEELEALSDELIIMSVNSLADINKQL